MNEIDSRLTRCFQAVFPKLSVASVPTASVDTVAGWDSVAVVQLLNLVSEEFGIETDWEQAEEMTSYPAIRKMIADHISIS